MSNKIEQIESYISYLKAIVSEKSADASEEEKKQIAAIAGKTLDVMNQTIDRVKSVRSQITNDQEYEQFLTRVLDKTTAVYRVTVQKIVAVKAAPKAEAPKEKTVLEIVREEEKKAGFEKIAENENIKPAANMAKLIKNSADPNSADSLAARIVNFIDSKETRDAVNRISLSVLNAADKGLDALIKLLDKGTK